MAQTNTSRIAKNTLFLYLRSFITLLISLYTSRVVLEVLGIEDYGIYNVVGGVIGMLSFLNTSMASTYQRYFNYEMGRKNERGVTDLFKSSLTVQLFYAIIIVLIAETVGLWFLENKLVIASERMCAAHWIYHISIVSFVLTVFQAPFNALIISYEKMGIFAYISISDSVLKLAIVLALPFFGGDKLIVYGFLGLFIIAINSIIYLVVCKSRFSACQLAFNWNKENIKSLLGFSAWGMMDSLSYTLKSQGLNIVLNMFFGLIVNAARGIAYQVLHAVEQFVRSFQMSFRPQLIKSYAEGDYNYMYKLYYSGTKLSFYMLWCLSLPIIIEAPVILQLWLGDNVPEYTVVFTRLILLTALVSAYANPTSGIAYATGNIKLFNIWVSGLNLLIVPVAYVFLRLGYSPASAMIVSLVMTILVQIVRLIVLKRLLVFSIWSYVTNVVVPTLSVMLLSSLLSFAFDELFKLNVFSFLLTCGFSILSVLSFAYFIGLNRDEKRLIENKILKKIKK